jgi:hypothetical protein
LGNECEYGAVVFFDLQSGLRLGLWPRKSIDHDTKLPLGKSSPTEFTLGHNVNSKKEVDDVMGRNRSSAPWVKRYQLWRGQRLGVIGSPC